MLAWLFDTGQRGRVAVEAELRRQVSVSQLVGCTAVLIGSGFVGREGGLKYMYSRIKCWAFILQDAQFRSIMPLIYFLEMT